MARAPSLPAGLFFRRLPLYSRIDRIHQLKVVIVRQATAIAEFGDMHLACLHLAGRVRALLVRTAALDHGTQMIAALEIDQSHSTPFEYPAPAVVSRAVQRYRAAMKGAVAVIWDEAMR